MCGEMRQGEVRRCCGSRCAGAFSAPHNIYHGIKLCSVSQVAFAIRLPPLPGTFIRGAYRDCCLTITRYPTEYPAPSD